MTAFPALVLAVALTYAVGDLYRPYVPAFFAYLLDLIIGVVIFRFTNSYLKRLKG